MEKWFFPPLSGGDKQGLNNSGVAMFKGIDSLTRETIQNVLDNPSDPSKPRIVEFEYLDLPRDKFPSVDDFTRIMESCRDYMTGLVVGGTDNESVFFDVALGLLNSSNPTIPTLRIRDSNTTGLLGNDDEDTKPFCRLLKVQGVSSIQGGGGGTHGIGQHAPFQPSSLRTILYYTKRHDDNCEAFIAKSILCTFKNPSSPEVLKQSKGYWCQKNDSDPDNWKTLRDGEKINDYFRRAGPGTDLYITGFILNDDNWEYEIRHAVLANFFAAIHFNELVVRIKKSGGGVKVIDASSLEAALNEAAEEQRLLEEDGGRERRFERNAPKIEVWNSLWFYKALKNGKSFTKVINGIDEVKFYVHYEPMNPDLSDSWGFMRSPHMLVGIRNAKVIRGFSGLLICDNKVGNKLLSRLEGPKHTEWSLKEIRNPLPDEVKNAKRIEKEIAEFVRESLKSLRLGSQTSELNPANLGNYLPVERTEGDGVTLGAGVDKTGEITDKPKTVRTDPVISDKPPKRRKRKKKNLLGSGHEEAEKPEKPEKPEENKVPKPKSMIIKNKDIATFRSFVITTMDGREASRLIVRCSKKILGDIELIASGEGTTASPVIIEGFDEESKKPLEVDGSIIKNLQFEKNKAKIMYVILDLGAQVCLSLKD